MKKFLIYQNKNLPFICDFIKFTTGFLLIMSFLFQRISSIVVLIVYAITYILTTIILGTNVWK